MLNTIPAPWNASLGFGRPFGWLLRSVQTCATRKLRWLLCVHHDGSSASCIYATQWSLWMDESHRKRVDRTRFIRLTCMF